MKMELKVLWEETFNQTHMTVKYGDDALGAITLTSTDQGWDVAARANRDAIAGVFLSSLTAGARLERKALKDG